MLNAQEAFWSYQLPVQGGTGRAPFGRQHPLERHVADSHGAAAPGHCAPTCGDLKSHKHLF
jgi:hypothetical protein